MPVEIGRVIKINKSLYMLLPPAILREIVLNAGDKVALRAAGEKLIVERIEIEKLARLRTGEVVA